MGRSANPSKTRRVSLSVTEQVADYLEDLAAQGLLGATASEVAKTFVQRGIEQAIKDDFLQLHSRDEGPRED